MKNLLLIFVKNPVLGKVKTRLAKTLGDKKALGIYNLLLQHTFRITANTSCDKAVFFTDFIDENLLPKHFPAQIYMQNGVDLGERMFNAFDFAFKKNYEKVVIIGSDCMQISTQIINEAFLELSIYGAVIGPANDGGYYLLGLNKMIASLFQNKTWSSPSVLPETLADLEKLSINYFLLPELIDIDTEVDWLAYKNGVAVDE